MERALTYALYKLQLQGAQLTLLQALASTLNRSDDLPAVQKVVFDLAKQLCEQKLSMSIFASPVLHFPSLLAIDPTNHLLASPTKFTPHLAAMLFTMRLVLLECGSPYAHREAQFDMNVFMKYHADHIADRAMTPISEVLSMLAYGKEVVKDFQAKPIVT